MDTEKDSRIDRKYSSKRIIITSFLVDFLDVASSFVIAILSGSVIMLSQFLEGMSDLTSSGFLLIGLLKSSRKEDKIHPFGYSREIYFWTLISSLVMFGIASTLSIYFGFQRFIHPQPVSNINLAFAILTITLFTNGYAFFMSLVRLLKRKNISQIFSIFLKSSLIEIKTTFILDLMGTLASLLGIFGLILYQTTGDFRYDGLGAMFIGIVLAFFSYLLILGIRDLLIGQRASAETEEKIIKSALSISEVKQVLDIKTLHLGSEKLLVNLGIKMESRLKTREIEKLIEKIKIEIQKEVPSAKYLQVELETKKS